MSSSLETPVRSHGVHCCFSLPEVAVALEHEMGLFPTHLTLLPIGWALFFLPFVLLFTMYILDRDGCILDHSVSLLLPGSL